jgi:hypothetical protein
MDILLRAGRRGINVFNPINFAPRICLEKPSDSENVKFRIFLTTTKATKRIRNSLFDLASVIPGKKTVNMAHRLKSVIFSFRFGLNPDPTF